MLVKERSLFQSVVAGLLLAAITMYFSSHADASRSDASIPSSTASVLLDSKHCSSE